MSNYPKAGMPSPPRNKLLSAIHAAKKRMGLDDGTYRDMLERLTGKRSAGAMEDKDLHEVLAHLNVSGAGRAGDAVYRRVVRAADGPNAALVNKIRALWISLAHLGEVDDRRDSALLAFVERQTGKQALEFLTPIDCNKVIEALKAWAARAGVEWDARNTGNDNGPLRFAEALWRKLHALGAVKIASLYALDMYAQRVCNIGHKTALGMLSSADQNRVVAALGRWHARARREASSAPPHPGPLPRGGEGEENV
jgi:phage gp16-like protein